MLGLHDPLHTEFLHGAVAAAHDLGYYLNVVLTVPGETEQLGSRIVRERSADGLIFSYAGVTHRRLRTLANEGVPVVLLQERVSTPGVHSVTAEDEVGIEDVVDLLHSLGHRRIAFVSADPPWPGPMRRLAAFFAAADRLGVESAEWTAHAYTINATRELLRDHSLGRSTDPTALIAVNDVVALGAMQHAQEIGLSIPEDLSVVGFNDFDFAAWVRPSITTVRLPGAEMGAYALRLAVDAAESRTAISAVAFRVSLVQRESTGPVRHK